MQLIQISAWNDSGGGFLHRLFDGHDQLNVWPFELLLGNDHLAPDRFSPEYFRGRFRWPRLQGLARDNGTSLFDQISDGELKAVLSAGQAAKHGGFNIPVSLDEWRDEVARLWSRQDRHAQSDFVSLYIETFLRLLTANSADLRKPLLGHCPAIAIDAQELWADFPDARIIHVVRSPLAGYADMRRRHASLVPDAYGKKWALINGLAAILAGKYPDRFKLVDLDSLVADRRASMAALSGWLGLEMQEAVLRPSWNGRPIDEKIMGPFGGVPVIAAGRDAELAAATPHAMRDILLKVTAGARLLLEDQGIVA